MNPLLIDLQNRTDISEKDVDALIDALADALGPKADVQVASSNQRGYGVTWWEVIHIYILDPALDVAKDQAKEAVAVIMGAAILWAKKRWNSRKGKRPTYICVRRRDGEPIQAYLLKDEQADPEDHTAEATRRPLP